MVVHDDADDRARLRNVFEEVGWTVTEAPGGAQALALLREPPLPDVLLLALAMSGMDGLAVLTELRTERRIHELPVVLLAARRSPLGDRLVEALGAESCIIKPFDPGVLLSRCAALAGSVRG